MRTTTVPEHHADDPGVPRAALWAMAALLLLAVGATAAVRWSFPSVRAPDAAPHATKLLRFVDEADGAVQVIDAAAARPLARLQGEQGFLRGTLRALARERRSRGVGSEAAFELTARTDGRLTLADPSTGARIDLESFGPANAGVFARLLGLEPAASSSVP